MTKNKLFLCLLTTTLCLCLHSCGDDEPGGDTPSDGTNTNANKSATAEARRLEIPRLVGGDNNLFLVKKAKLSDIGSNNGSNIFVNFCVEWDCNKKAQRWTAYRWDIDNTRDNNVGRYDIFEEDTDIPLAYRTGYSNHQGNGCDRGHMIASEDRQCSESANAQTFLYSNMHPQYDNFNGKSGNTTYVWYNLEICLRKMYAAWSRQNNAGDTIYVVKGGTIADNQIIKTMKGIPVPKYFFVAVLYKIGKSMTNGGYKAIGFWIEHKEGDTTNGSNLVSKYGMSIDKLEEKTGIDFFCNLPDDIENVVEKSYNVNAWSAIK